MEGGGGVGTEWPLLMWPAIGRLAFHGHCRNAAVDHSAVCSAHALRCAGQMKSSEFGRSVQTFTSGGANLRQLCSSIRVGTAVISAAREAPPGLLALDKASDLGAGDSKLESWADRMQRTGQSEQAFSSGGANLRMLCSSIRVGTAVISAAREAPPGLLA